MAFEGGGKGEISPEQLFEEEVVRTSSLFISECRKMILEYHFIYNTANPDEEEVSMEKKMEMLEGLLKSEEKNILLILETGINIFYDLSVLWERVFGGVEKEGSKMTTLSVVLDETGENSRDYNIGVLQERTNNKGQKKESRARLTRQLQNLFKGLKRLREKHEKPQGVDKKTITREGNFPQSPPSLEEVARIKAEIDRATNAACVNVLEKFTDTSPENTDARGGLRLIQGGKS